MGILQMGLLLYIMSFVILNATLSEALGATHMRMHINILAFSLLYTPISTVIGVLSSVLSRKHEYEADAFAVRTTQSVALKKALNKLSQKNLSHLCPHWLYVFFKYSHPPLLQRLQAIDHVKEDNEV